MAQHPSHDDRRDPFLRIRRLGVRIASGAPEVRQALRLAFYVIQEVGQADPLAPYTYLFAHLARGIAGIGLAHPVGSLACGQVCGKQACSAIAIRAAVQDMDFEHRCLLSGLHQVVESKKPASTQQCESRRAWIYAMRLVTDGSRHGSLR